MQTMRLADYVVSFLKRQGIDTAFMVTGGMAMHLNDALALEPDITKVCCHHEQACSLAAEAYAHVTSRPALVQVTSGPGAINAMTGVFSAYVDGLPMIVISGQPKRELICASYDLVGAVRQIGEQESQAVDMARSITKYSVRIMKPDRIRYELEKAFFIACTGRPGPVWLEIPLDVQAAVVSPELLDPFRVPEVPPPDLSHIAVRVAQRLAQAERPVLVVGPGLRVDGAVREFLELADGCGCPVVCAGVLDIVQAGHPLYAGAMGAGGNRAGNIAVQNADLLLFLGVTMHITFTTYNWQAMGKNAYKIVVEQDLGEFERPQFLGDEGILCRAGDFIRAFHESIRKERLPDYSSWLAFCKERLRLLPFVADYQHTVNSEGRINAYWFTEELCKRLRDDDVLVPGNATSGVTVQQAGRLRPGQRMIANFGCGPMGIATPAAVGAAYAVHKEKRIICLDGDGSVMMNIQEFATIRGNNLPIVMFIYNNDGYTSIRQSQKNFCTGQIGYSPDNGVYFPKFVEVAKAFGIPSRCICGADFQKQLDEVLQEDGPFIAEVLLDSEQGFEPKISSKRLPDGRMISLPPEDMYPFLPREELQAHLLFPLFDEG